MGITNVQRACGAGVPVYTRDAITMLCGYFDFGMDGPNPVLQALPQMILLRREKIAKTAALESLVRMIIDEAASGRSGHQAVVDKLCDVLFVMILRICIDSTPELQGLLAALPDPRLQRVGTRPLQYLAEWRMQVAAERLRDPHLPVAEIAGRVGYDTEAVFRGVFRRVKGVEWGAAGQGGH